MQPGSFVNMTIVISGNTAIELNTLIYGSYNANNILAGVCIGKYFKVPDDVIRHAIESYQPSNNRSQVMQTTRNMLILDAYNANPSSMKAALEAFSASGHTNKSVILGDMLELGESSDEEHLKILGSLKNIDLCRVYLVGPRFTRLNTTRDFICFNDAELARLWFEHEKPENETILLKGSRGIGLERLVETL
jgi:UDP-N-acetylmuramoyl-tripeptide--D-alanyl-D-alanine ligase